MQTLGRREVDAAQDRRGERVGRPRHKNPDGGGTYVIVHVASGRRYAGSTEKFSLRFPAHRSNLRAGRHYNPALQRDWTTFGENAFKFEVFDLLETSSELKRRSGYEYRLIKSIDPALCYNVLSDHERSTNRRGVALRRRILKLTAEQWTAFDARGGLAWLGAVLDGGENAKA